MSNASDGGPAFPQGMAVGDVAKMEGGMTLRDWFAGQALAGMWARGSDEDYSVDARAAFKAAAAMLAERAKAVR